MKKSIVIGILTLMIFVSLIKLLPNAKAAAPCPSHDVWMEEDPENEGKCIIKANICRPESASYVLRWRPESLIGWTYVLMDLNQLNLYCEPPCHYYTCARGNQDCRTYIWELGYFDDVDWVRVYPVDEEDYQYVDPPE